MVYNDSFLQRADYQAVLTTILVKKMVSAPSALTDGSMFVNAEKDWLATCVKKVISAINVSCAFFDCMDLPQLPFFIIF